MFAIGADPEFFITDGNSGPVVPIVGLLGGTKDKPIPVGGTAGFAVQEDNVMAEYNIPPAGNYERFAEYVEYGRLVALDRVRKKFPSAQVLPHCAASFTMQQLATPQAQMFGCSPDFDGHSMGAPLPRIDPRALTNGDTAWRFAGGHVHLGYKADLSWELPEFVVATLCDAIISIPAIVHGYDYQGERRRWYGTPGRYRPTKHGVEYRTLGNTWTLNRRNSMFVGASANYVMDVLRDGEKRVRQLYNDLPWNDIRRAISTEDEVLAGQLHSFMSGLGIRMV